MKLTDIPLPADSTIDKAVLAISLGRIVPYGAPSWVVPTLSARVLGAGPAASEPHTRYLMRIFGIRAVALGASYLLNTGSARRTSQRLALVVDTADTLMTPFCGLPRTMVVRSLLITVPYAAVGWARALKDLQNNKQREQ
jgi:hypothetical protein